MKIKYWIFGGIAAIILAGAIWLGCTYTIIGGQIYNRDVTTVNLADIDLKNPERVAQLKNLQVADLRNTGLTPAEYDQIRTALPDCQILWLVPFQGKYLDPDSASLTVSSITEEEMALLDYFPGLQTIDMMDCTDVDAILKVIELHPQCDVRWMIPFQGQPQSYDAHSLSISTLSQDDLTMIGYFTELESVDARKCSDLEAIAALRQQYPDLEVKWQVSFQGKSYGHDITTLELADADAEELMTQLQYLPQLETLTLTGTGPSLEVMDKLVETYPNVNFGWDFQLCGVTVNTNAKEIDLSHIQMESVEEVENSLKYFNCLEKVVMFKCGISSEDMDALWKRHPETRFIWGIYFGGYCLRTDETGFMPWKYGYTRDGRPGMSNAEAQNLKYMVDLVAIDIGHNDITDLSFLYYTPNVEFLMMCGTGASDLTPVGSLKKLKYLELWENPVKDLSPLAGCTALEDINIYRLAVEDLSPLLGLNLKNIWYNARLYSEEQVTMLREAYPDALIVSNPMWATSQGWRRIPNYYAQRDALDMFYMDSAGEGKNKNW